jgi:pyruvate/2-oxoglutarate dehydrogenase complex dihydrolipoamide acyltransferase (E2) component
MMTLIRLPKFGWIGMPRCRNKVWLGRWCKSNGCHVEADEVVALVETPKTNIEITSPSAGVLFWMKKNNTRLHMMDVLGVVLDKVSTQ